MNSKKTMLIVDDQIIMQEFLYSFFSDEFEVVCKEDGGAAMSWLKTQKVPDIILADVNMPGINGIEFLNGLANDQDLSAIPTIMLSGNNDSAARIAALKLGAKDFVSKPFNPEELNLRIKACI